MKVVGFDIIKSTLEIKFASDLAEKPIEQYETHLFNVVQNGEVTNEEIIKELAKNGWNIALQQEIAEQIAKDNEKVSQYKSYVNQEFEYTAEELFNPQSTIPAEDQPISTGLMVI
jgi:DNA-binding PucR family transcriptional regulator